MSPIKNTNSLVFDMKTYVRFKEMHKKVSMSTPGTKRKLDLDDKCNKLKFEGATQVEFKTRYDEYTDQ